MIPKRLKAWIAEKILPTILSEDAASEIIARISASARRAALTGSSVGNQTREMTDEITAATNAKLDILIPAVADTHRELLDRWAKAAMQNAKSSLLSESGQDLATALEKMMKTAFTMGIDAYMNALVDHKTKFASRPFPPGTKFAESRGSHDYYVIEMPPAVREINYFNAFYRVSMPYLVVVAHLAQGKLAGMYLFFRRTRITSVHDNLLTPCLPNIHTDGRLCIAPHQASSGQIDCGINDAITTFLASRFNADIPTNLQNCFKHSEVKSFGTWEALTEHDPNCGVAINWPSFLNEFTIRRFLDNQWASAAMPDQFPLVKKRAIESFKSEAKELILETLKNSKLTPQALDKDIEHELTALFAELATGVQAVLQEEIAGMLITEAWQASLDDFVEQFADETGSYFRELFGNLVKREIETINSKN